MAGEPTDKQWLKTIVKSGLGLLLSGIIAFGDATTSIIMRLTKAGGVPDFQSIFWNQVASMIFVLFLVAAVRPKLSGTTWKLTAGLVVGGLLRVLANLLECLSYLHAMPGNTWAVVYGLSPLLTIGVSSVSIKERPNVVHMVGMVLCTAGVTMAGVSMNMEEVNYQTLQQQVLTLLYPIAASVLFAVCWVMLRWLSKEGVPLVTQLFYYSISGGLLLPLAYMVETPEWSFSAGVWGLLVAQTLTYAMFLISNVAAIHNETVITVQMLKVLTVPIAFVLGYFVLKMVPTSLEWCGGAFVTVGAMLVAIWTWRLNLMEERHTQLMASLGFPHDQN